MHKIAGDCGELDLSQIIVRRLGFDGNGGSLPPTQINAQRFVFRLRQWFYDVGPLCLVHDCGYGVKKKKDKETGFVLWEVA